MVNRHKQQKLLQNDQIIKYRKKIYILASGMGITVENGLIDDKFDVGYCQLWRAFAIYINGQSKHIFYLREDRIIYFVLMNNSPADQGRPECIYQHLRLEELLEQFEEIIDFRIANGERWYRSRWLRGGGKEVVKWLPFRQMHSYLKQVLVYEEKHRKSIFESECAWNSLLNDGEVTQRLQTLNVAKLRKMFYHSKSHEQGQSSGSQFVIQKKRTRRIQKAPQKKKIKASNKKTRGSKKAKPVKTQQKGKAKNQPRIRETQLNNVGFRPNTQDSNIKQGKKQQTKFIFRKAQNKVEAEPANKAQELVGYSTVMDRASQQPQVPAGLSKEQSGDQLHSVSVVGSNGEEMSETPVSPQTIPRRPILTDESQNDSHDEDEFSYESEQVSEVVNQGQIRQFIEVKLKQIQNNQNQEGTAKWQFDSHEGQVKLEAGPAEEQIKWETPPRKQQQGSKWKDLRQSPVGLLDAFSGDFQGKMEQLRKVKDCRLPESFANFIASKILREEQLESGRVRVNNIISLYNMRDFCYFAVNIGNNYYEEQRFIEYRLLKAKCLPLLLRWLHLH